MKKVSFIKGCFYPFSEVEVLNLPMRDRVKHFQFHADKLKFYCFNSFTAEITVKIVPYEGS